jgi:hypothetical protein
MEEEKKDEDKSVSGKDVGPTVQWKAKLSPGCDYEF